MTIVFAFANTNRARAAPAPNPAGTVTIPPLVGGIVPALNRPSAGPIYVRLASPDAWPFAAGVILALDRRGYETVVEPSEAWLLGEPKSKPPGSRVATVLTFANSTTAPGIRAQAGQREVAHGTAYQEMYVFVRSG